MKRTIQVIVIVLAIVIIPQLIFGFLDPETNKTLKIVLSGILLLVLITMFVLVLYVKKRVTKIYAIIERISTDDFEVIQNELLETYNSKLTLLKITTRFGIVLNYLANDKIDETKEAIENTTWGRYYGYISYHRFLLALNDDDLEKAKEYHEELNSIPSNELKHQNILSDEIMKLVEEGTCDFSLIEESMFPVVARITNKYKTIEE